MNESGGFIEREVTVNELKTKPSEFSIFITPTMPSFTVCLNNVYLILFHLLLTEKLKKKYKHKKKHLTNSKKSNIEEVQRVVDEEKLDEISSVDEDCTRGMKSMLHSFLFMKSSYTFAYYLYYFIGHLTDPP